LHYWSQRLHNRDIWRFPHELQPAFRKSLESHRKRSGLWVTSAILVCILMWTEENCGQDFHFFLPQHRAGKSETKAVCCLVRHVYYQLCLFAGADFIMRSTEHFYRRSFACLYTKFDHGPQGKATLPAGRLASTNYVWTKISKTPQASFTFDNPCVFHTIQILPLKTWRRRNGSNYSCSPIISVRYVWPFKMFWLHLINRSNFLICNVNCRPRTYFLLRQLFFISVA